jgi:hypothetical protein
MTSGATKKKQRKGPRERLNDIQARLKQYRDRLHELENFKPDYDWSDGPAALMNIPNHDAEVQALRRAISEGEIKELSCMADVYELLGEEAQTAQTAKYEEVEQLREAAREANRKADEANMEWAQLAEDSKEFRMQARTIRRHQLPELRAKVEGQAERENWPVVRVSPSAIGG